MAAAATAGASALAKTQEQQSALRQTINKLKDSLKQAISVNRKTNQSVNQATQTAVQMAQQVTALTNEKVELNSPGYYVGAGLAAALVSAGADVGGEAAVRYLAKGEKVNTFQRSFSVWLALAPGLMGTTMGAWAALRMRHGSKAKFSPIGDSFLRYTGVASTALSLSRMGQALIWDTPLEALAKLQGTRPK